MDPMKEKQRDYLMSVIPTAVNEIGKILQQAVIDAYQQGCNDTIEELLTPSFAGMSLSRITGYKHSETGIKYTINPTDDLFYIEDEFDLGLPLVGLPREYFSTTYKHKYTPTKAANQDGMELGVGDRVKFGEEEVTVYDIVDPTEGPVMLNVGPSLREYVSGSRTTSMVAVTSGSMKLVSIDDVVCHA